ncbi:MAG TPA: hypothetical protein VMT95_02115 [Candidatus Binatia bacterium]|nr:hypothetical protein [Candidatus Binatia bacterium]
MNTLLGRVPLAALAVTVAVAAPFGPAGATGTARVVQRDGSQKTYTNVRISIKNGSMAITSADGQGTIVLGDAACTKVGELLECLPYDATLLQYGRKTHISLQSGTVWLNPSKTRQPLSHSSTQLPPRGVLLAVRTKKGTYVTLTGVVDEVQK